QSFYDRPYSGEVDSRGLYSDARRALKSFSAVQNGDCRHGYLFVLSRGDAANTDCSDNLAVDDHRHSSLHGYDSINREEGGLPSGNGLFHGLGWPFEEGGGSRFSLRNSNASRLRFIEFVKHDEAAMCVNDGNRDGPAVFPRFRLACLHHLFR